MSTLRYESELYHYGVKGMKWGHRKKTPLGKKKEAYKKAKKEYNRAYNKASAKAIAAYSPVKKHRQASDARWEDVIDKGQTLNKAKKDYKQAKKEKRKKDVKKVFTKDTAKKSVSTGAKVAANLIRASIIDDVYFYGAGRKAIKNTGRAATESYLKARGATSVTWLD